MGERQVVESYARQFATLRPLAEQTRSSARTRLVWYVALSGFVILNGKPLWDSLSNTSFTGLALALLLIPWVLAAFAAMVTHFIIDEAGVRDDLYAVQKAAQIDLYLVALDKGDADPREMLDFINDTSAPLKEPKAQADYFGRLSRTLERLTFSLILLGFFWSVLGPFILACHH